ncbi:MAG: type I-C CRISPR-associated protein Cas7/Csd2 [Candidatus Desulforudis sp.]|nr:type I-C CRISPR-associated protein Cas7/Csd2 [Desulforudis sp.]MBV1734198.1 type I-C CRISPR-associated protein Cas7/Csd2 [Desulforudis sp.]
MAIESRYEFLYFVECINGNPNGDPDMGNSPRLDPQDMHGLISDVAIKRRIRNYVQLAHGNEAPFGIVVQQATNINKFIALAHEQATGNPKKGDRVKTSAARKWLCQNFYDVRTFGGVMSTGANAGQIRGAVQLTFLRSLDQILPLDVSITRMAVASDAPGKEASYAEYEEWENKQSEDKLRTMGRKQLIPYGLYQGKGFISAHLAEDTTFNDQDLNVFWDALLNMYEHDRSSSKGHMSTVPPVIVFRHIGTDTDLTQRARQAKLGCAPAHKLFDLVAVEKNAGVAAPRSYRDYSWVVQISKMPPGVEVGFAVVDAGKASISWGKLPDGLETIRLV